MIGGCTTIGRPRPPSPISGPRLTRAARPDLYELENQAVDPEGFVLAAMRRLAPWRGRTLIDLGPGSGYWLPGYADEAAQVVGIEPDPDLLPLAAARDQRVQVLPGSAEHIPLPDASADVVHARFTYFWPPKCSAGLAEVLRVLRPGGALVVVDNDYRHGEFAELLRAAGAGAPGRPEVTDGWWAERGAERTEVMSRWQFTSRADFAAAASTSCAVSSTTVRVVAPPPELTASPAAAAETVSAKSATT